MLNKKLISSLIIVLNCFLINAMQDNTGSQISNLRQQEIEKK